MLIARRSFLTGLASLVAAPAIVRAESLMPVRAPRSILVPSIISFDHDGFTVSWTNCGFGPGDIVNVAWEYGFGRFEVTETNTLRRINAEPKAPARPRRA